MTPPACRLCGDKLAHVFVDLGEMPLACRVIAVETKEERRFPLRLRVCDRCLLVQSDAGADGTGATGKALPSLYLPATGRTANAMVDRFGLGRDSLVMEVASTDGTRLRPFQDAGMAVLGIEPNEVLAELARSNGVPTECALLNAETAMDIAVRHGRADFVVAHGVLAEVADLFGFAAGFAGILRPNGIVAFDFPHLLWMVDQTRFDCIDHGHRSYLSLLVVERVLRSVGLLVFDLERLPPPGGGLRVFAGHGRGPYMPRPSVQSMRLQEVAARLDQPPQYNLFALKAAASIQVLREFVDSRRQSGRRIVAYGVTAEANTLLNCCGLGHNDILCIADPDTERQAMLLPGSHIPIVSPRMLLSFRPDDVLVFPPDGPLDAAMELASHLPGATCFWSLMPAPRPLALRSEAT